jgi:hypothetical protein
LKQKEMEVCTFAPQRITKKQDKLYNHSTHRSNDNLDRLGKRTHHNSQTNEDLQIVQVISAETLMNDEERQFT